MCWAAPGTGRGGTLLLIEPPRPSTASDSAPLLSSPGNRALPSGGHEVPESCDELAAGRAMVDLAHQLETAERDIQVMGAPGLNTQQTQGTSFMPRPGRHVRGGHSAARLGWRTSGPRTPEP
ncbi:dsRBD fold-containing protein [Streptomyces sp. NPDC004546]|uniref:dsRBD fold-containing protein n=1 Tax=unclassified Streptomyces TaxID=2593676 RepID=UPI0033BA076C